MALSGMQRLSAAKTYFEGATPGDFCYGIRISKIVSFSSYLCKIPLTELVPMKRVAIHVFRNIRM